MDLTRWINAKKQKKLTIADIAEKAGLPKGTVQNIFAGYVPSPRLDTVQAIERALELNKKSTTPFFTSEELEFIDNFRKLPAEAKDAVSRLILSYLS